MNLKMSGDKNIPWMLALHSARDTDVEINVLRTGM
jgi:hypothetical protein